MSFIDAASELRVPPELLDFKFCILKNKGYKVIALLLMAGGFHTHIRYINMNVSK